MARPPATRVEKHGRRFRVTWWADNLRDIVKPKKPRPPEKLIHSPTAVEKIVIVAEEEDPIWGLFLNITATLGTRRGETCALRWETSTSKTFDCTGSSQVGREALGAERPEHLGTRTGPATASPG